LDFVFKKEKETNISYRHLCDAKATTWSCVFITCTCANKKNERYVLDEEVEDNGAFIARIVVDLLLLLQMGVKGVMMLLMLMQRKWILLGELVIEHPPVVLQPTVVSTRPCQRGGKRRR